MKASGFTTLLACLALTGPAAAADAELEARVEALETELESVRTASEVAKPGTRSFLITGYGSAGFIDRQGENSTFQAQATPAFLWLLGDNLFFESEVQFGLSDTETDVELEYADINYTLFDFLTVGAGKFLAPFSIFSERLHPSWINKLPDAPLAFAHGGLVPTSMVGIQARGGVAIRSTRVNYSVYVANGPSAGGHGSESEEDDHGDSESAGSLDFENYDNFDDSAAAGGRIGFLPIPELELGYSVYVADVDTEDGNQDVVLHGVDFTYVLDSDRLHGLLDLRSEWVWSDAGDAFADPAHEEEDDGHEEEEGEHEEAGFASRLRRASSEVEELVRFKNSRTGGYAQAAYRPTKAGVNVLRNIEFVTRYELLDEPDASPEENDRQRWTIGLNYWIGPSAVVKAAYQFDDPDHGPTADAVLLQAALGF